MDCDNPKRTIDKSKLMNTFRINSTTQININDVLFVKYIVVDDVDIIVSYALTTESYSGPLVKLSSFTPLFEELLARGFHDYKISDVHLLIKPEEIIKISHYVDTTIDIKIMHVGGYSENLLKIPVKYRSEMSTVFNELIDQWEKSFPPPNKIIS